jgi:hypothetical protein
MGTAHIGDKTDFRLQRLIMHVALPQSMLRMLVLFRMLVLLSHNSGTRRLAWKDFPRQGQLRDGW